MEIEDWIIKADRSLLNNNYKFHLMKVRLYNKEYALEIPDFMLHPVTRIFNESFKLSTIDL